MSQPTRDLKLDLHGDDVRVLHEQLALLGATVPDTELQHAQYGQGTHDAIAQFQRGHGLEATGVVDPATTNALAAAVQEIAYTVRGKVTSPDRAGLGGLRVILIDRNVGEDVTLGATTTTRAGAFQLRFSQRSLDARGKSRPDLQAHVHAGKVLLASSRVDYNAARETNLDVALPARALALPAEHETLTADLAPFARAGLAAVHETAARPDITYLANKTGWDARAVALAALADRFSAADHGKLAPSLYYALFRAGLPANPGLYRCSSKAVRTIWEHAVEQGVIPAIADVAAQAAAFEELAAVHGLDAPSPTGTSTLRELLRTSIGDDAQKQTRFAQLQAAHRDDPDAMWAAVETAFGADTTSRLRFDGQLAFLTGDNAPLIAKLHAHQPLSAPIDLVAAGYHRASAWSPLVDGVVPRTIPGATAAARRQRYAEVLAAQVRLAFPTAIVADGVRSGDLPLSDAGTRDAVHRFLTAHQSGFEIGTQPIEQYLAHNRLTAPSQVVAEIKRLQRVYQITADDSTMATLLGRGLDSAYRIARTGADAFVRLHGAALGGDGPARALYLRAQQIHSAVLNLATGYLLDRRAPSVPFIERSTGGAADSPGEVPANATLETLFGSMDFCACTDCQSVLSPAAYLVDLLQLIDVPADDSTQNPYEVLYARRPDLAALPLTCENTNTALPYIDLVNEILEYFVKNGTILGYTGHDTDDTVTSAELLAAPQFTDDDAYTKLQGVLFPPPLPFHQPLEALRRTFRTFEVPLHEAMETLRVDDGVATWRDILLERLTLSRLEYGVLTQGSDTLADLYGLPDGPDLIATIENVQRLTRRLQITYDDLVAILETLTINAEADWIPLLEDLDLPFSTIEKVHQGLSPQEQAAFDAAIAGVDPAEYGGDIQGWLRTNYDKITGLVLITNPIDPTNLCALDQLALRFPKPSPDDKLRAFDFVRLMRFVRLWKKLGWTIPQVDAAITALSPVPAPTGDDAADLAALDAAYQTLLSRLGIVDELIDCLHLSVDRDLLPLLACFAPIGTYGERSLYRSMFLTAPVLDEAFAENAAGSVLTKGDEPLLAHSEALRAAFALTDEELQVIVDELGYVLDPANPNDPTKSTPLGLEQISAVFRFGWLARKLRLSVLELVRLRSSSGIDPFAPPDPPLPGIIRVLDLVDLMRAASLRPSQALYLIWNQDLSGQSAPSDAEVTQLARALRAAFAAVDVELAPATDDPSGDLARARLALAFGSDVADFYVGLLGSTYATVTPYARATPLPDAVVAASGGQLSYDDFRKQLVWLGVMSAQAHAALAAAAAGDADLATKVDELSATNAAVIGAFFARYPGLAQPLTDFLASSADISTRWTSVVTELLPALIDRRKRQQALAVVAGATNTDAALAQALLDDATVLHALSAPDAGGLDDLLAIGTEGAAPAGSWTGYLEAAESADLNLAIVADPSATVTATFNGSPLSLVAADGTWTSATELALTAGALYALDVAIAGATSLSLRWETPSRGWEEVPATHLYPASMIDPLRRVYLAYLKASTLGASLLLTPRETAHLAADPDLAIDGAPWLEALASSGQGDALTKVLITALDLAHLKATYSPDDERLVDVLDDPALLLPSGDGALTAMTGWDDASLATLYARYSVSETDLSHVEVFRRLADSFALAKRTGVSADALAAATTNQPSNDSVATALQAAVRARYDEADWLAVVKPINDDLRELQRDALVAYILSAFAMSTDPRQQAVDTADKMFDYFLVDVMMEPCMETSRVRLALSSVQLFIERCLMNLETGVAVDSIKADWWTWMKRYRVWEANRKVFLWPENWLEPELRDDTSPFYDDVMGELLQSDITDDAAASALRRYLTKLEGVARLDPCGMYQEEKESGDADDVVHVVACTPGTDRKYYYRCKQDASWSPWQEVKLDIEDRPVIPVVWNGRLFLFWLRILNKSPRPSDQPNEKPKDSKGNETTLSDTKPSKLKQASLDDSKDMLAPVYALLCYTEYCDGKWTPTKTSDKDEPLDLGTYKPGSDPFDRRNLSLSSWEVDDPNGDEPILVVWVSGATNAPGGTTFVLYNTHSSPEANGTLPLIAIEMPITTYMRTLDTDATRFAVHYGRLTEGVYQENTTVDCDVLDNALEDRTVEPNNAVSDVWNAPFLYRDRRHVFYVTTTEAYVTFPGSGGYGRGLTVGSKVPDLVLATSPGTSRPDPAGPIERGANIGIAERSEMQRFIADSKTLTAGVASAGTVAIDGIALGPNGAIGGAHE